MWLWVEDSKMLVRTESFSDFRIEYFGRRMIIVGKYRDNDRQPLVIAEREGGKDTLEYFKKFLIDIAAKDSPHKL